MPWPDDFDQAMITLRAVVELDQPGKWLELDGGCTVEQAGLFVNALVGVSAESPVAERVETVIADEMLIVLGGLVLGDTTTGVSVFPGCCAGLEDWPVWTTVAAGESPWMGHGPVPWVQVIGDRLRVWQDQAPGSAHVDVTGDQLARLLPGVRRDLAGFLEVLREWARVAGAGEREDEFVAAIDRAFSISAPWPADE